MTWYTCQDTGGRDSWHGHLSPPAPSTHTTDMPVGTFAVRASITNPSQPERRMALELLVDTRATWTLLPEEVVSRLGLATPRQRSVTLASGERATYPAGQVAMQLNGEEEITTFLAGPSNCLALLGAVTLEQFGLAPDPVKKTLVSVGGLLA